MVLSNDPDRKMSLTGAIMRHTTLRMRDMGMGTPEVRGSIVGKREEGHMGLWDVQEHGMQRGS